MLGENVLVLAKVAGEKAEFLFLHFCNIWMDFWGSEGLFPQQLSEKGNSIVSK